MIGGTFPGDLPRTARGHNGMDVTEFVCATIGFVMIKLKTCEFVHQKPVLAFLLFQVCSREWLLNLIDHAMTYLTHLYGRMLSATGQPPKYEIGLPIKWTRVYWSCGTPNYPPRTHLEI
jgi:hypothetical protein